MKKLFKELLFLLFLFLSLWAGMSAIPWIDIFKPKEKKLTIEQKIEDFYTKTLSSSKDIIQDENAHQIIDSIKYRICSNNDIDPVTIKIHLQKSKEVNAYAFPGGNLVIFTGLIKYCNSAEEVAGVIAHEIAHIEKGHLFQKISREIGFSVLLSAMGSSSGTTEAIKAITSSAYDRKMETEADDTAVHYLLKSNINPGGMADLMFRLSSEESSFMKQLSFLSTHPNSDERAERIFEMSLNHSSTFKNIVGKEIWRNLQDSFEQ